MDSIIGVSRSEGLQISPQGKRQRRSRRKYQKSNLLGDDSIDDGSGIFDEYPNDYKHTGYINPFWRVLLLFLIFALAAIILGFTIDAWNRGDNTKDSVHSLEKRIDLTCKSKKDIYRFAVGVFGDDYTSIINTDASNSMYQLKSSQPTSRTGYPVYVSENDELWVADNENDLIYVFDPTSNRLKDIITGIYPNCSEPFHMFYNENAAGEGQGRVVLTCTGSDSFMVLSAKDHCVLESVIIPDQYIIEYDTHDILVGPGYVAVTLFHFPQTSGIVLIYALSGDDPATLFTTIDLGTSYDPHVWRNNAKSGAAMYIACQGGSDVFKYSWGDFVQQGRVTGVIAAHGIVSDPTESYLYVSSITNPTGISSIYKFNIKGGKFETPSTLNLPIGNPHNLRIGGYKSSKFLTTHTAFSLSTMTDLDSNGNFVTGTSKTLATGPASMGVTDYTVPCVCEACKK